MNDREIPTPDQLDVVEESDIERRTQFFNKPHLMQVVCRHIENGGTLPELADTWGILSSDLHNWIVYDQARTRMYRKSIQLRAEWQKESLLLHIRDMAMLDLDGVYDDDGNPRPWKDIPNRIKRCIQHVKRTETDDSTTTELKFYDKVKAIDMLGKEIGMFKNKVEVSGKLSLEELVDSSWNKEEKSE